MSEKLDHSSQELNSLPILETEVELYKTIVQEFLLSHGYGSRDVIGQLKTYKPMESCDAVYTYLCMCRRAITLPKIYLDKKLKQTRSS